MFHCTDLPLPVISMARWWSAQVILCSATNPPSSGSSHTCCACWGFPLGHCLRAPSALWQRDPRPTPGLHEWERENEKQSPDADSNPCLDGAGAFPNPSVRRGTALSFHFSRGGSWHVSGASGKFSPSWWGDLVHKSVVRSGQDYSLA